jgi:cell shape-determining protein MreD
MSGPRTFLLVIFLLISSWLQAAIASRIQIFHAEPDFVLTTLVCICILVGTVHGTMLSVWAGFLTSVLAGVNYGSIMVSRLVTGSLSGSVQRHIIQDNIFIPPTTLFVATWLTEGLYFLMAPNLQNLRWWTHMVLGQAIYNSVLSLPIYFGLRYLKFGAETEQGYNPFIENM